MGDYKLISVESRKGGVGKTTAALNLGYLLREKYHVLLLDIDITGTSISAIQKSRFWMNDTFLLKNGEEPINLLQYFANTFLKGEDLFEFTVEDDPDKVQVTDNGIVSSNFASADFRKMRTDSFQKSRTTRFRKIRVVR